MILWCVGGALSAPLAPAHAQVAAQPATAYTLIISRAIQGGAPVTLECRGISAGGAARLDIAGGTDSASFPAGSYLLMSDSSGAARLVDPARRIVHVIGAGARLGGLVELYTPPGRVSDVVVTVDTLGAGEIMEGSATRRYRITTRFTLALTSTAGQGAEAQSASVTDLWQAEGLTRIPNPFVGLGGDDAPGEMLAPLNAALVAVGHRLPGVTLRSETHATLSARGVTFTAQQVNTRLSGLHPATVDPDALRVPPGFVVK